MFTVEIFNLNINVNWKLTGMWLVVIQFPNSALLYCSAQSAVSRVKLLCGRVYFKRKNLAKTLGDWYSCSFPIFPVQRPVQKKQQVPINKLILLTRRLQLHNPFSESLDSLDSFWDYSFVVCVTCIRMLNSLYFYKGEKCFIKSYKRSRLVHGKRILSETFAQIITLDMVW